MKYSSKKRLLQLIQIMQQHSDEAHPLTLNEIVDLFPLEVDVNPTTVKADLDELVKSTWFRIHRERRSGLESLYWYGGIGLQLPELRLLVDAVMAAKFIPPQESVHLVDTLKKFSGLHVADEMDKQIFVAEEMGIALKQIGDTVHLLHEAIHQSNVIQFQYGKYNTEKEFVLNRNGDFYQMKPYALVWSNDFYYLIAVPKDGDGKKHFRIDRMRNLSLQDIRFVREPSFDVNAYLQTLFHMYAGEDISMEVEFDNHLINVVIDKFGTKADIRPQSNGRFKLFTKAVYSDGLVRWLLTWGSDAEVLSPPKLVERMKEEAVKLYQQYY